MAPALPQDPRAWREWGALEDVTDLRRRGLLDPPPAQPRPGGAVLPRLRAADLRLTRRGVLVHRLLALDLLHEDRVTAALADLGLPRYLTAAIQRAPSARTRVTRFATMPMTEPTRATHSRTRKTTGQRSESPKSNGKTCSMRTTAASPTAVVTTAPAAVSHRGSRTR